MRIVMAGPGEIIALQRPLAWALHAGHEVWLVSRKDAFQAGGPANYHFIPAPPGAGAAGQADDRLRMAAQAQQWAEQARPAVIHAHNLEAEAVWCAAAGLRPLIVSAWSALDILLHAPDQPLPTRARAILNAAQALIVESPKLVEACRALPAPRPEIALIPLGVNLQRFHAGDQAQGRAWRRTLKIAEDAIVLLSPRGWSRRYNHDLILEAFNLARPRFRAPAILVFVNMGRNSYPGEAEQCQENVRPRAAALGLSAAIRWLPGLIHAMMPGLYALADVVISYPTHDAFPSTLVEAAACERPIITARLPSYTGTFIEEYATAVEPNQPAALADALIQVVNQPAQARAERLRQARQAVGAHYDERLAQARLLQLYATVAAHAEC